MPMGGLRVRLFLAALLGGSLVSVAAELKTAPIEPTDTASRADLVDSGENLEQAHRWLDAIQYYEAALKRFPEDDALKLGLRRAKIHFGINRRYADTSFNSDLRRLPRSELLELVDDILFKIKSHFVENLSLTSLVAHGTECFYYSLANNDFLEANVPGSPTGFDADERRSRIRRMRSILRQKYWNRPIADRMEALATIREITDIAERTLHISGQCVILEYIFGFCNPLDDYSNFLTPDRLTDLYDTIDGNFVGIGIEMKAETAKGLLLVNVLPESPAEEGGARAGDHIVQIDGVDCRNMSTDEAANLLRGPEGSRVRVRLVGVDASDVRDATFVRRHVEVKSIPVVRILDEPMRIGYFKMTGFQKSTPDELDAALAKLHRQGVRAIIWDVRGNPGGLLTAAVEVLDRFIDNGVLVSTRGRTRDQNWNYQAHQPGTWDVPLVLLTDSQSASASEIVAGAVRDYHRGMIVGRHTYGKWSVQSIFPVRDASGLRLTTARFYSPQGHTYGKIGLSPDVVVEGTSEHVVGYRGARDPIADEDPDIQRALELLRTQMSSR